jgi:hypothetical protein
MHFLTEDANGFNSGPQKDEARRGGRTSSRHGQRTRPMVDKRRRRSRRTPEAPLLVALPEAWGYYYISRRAQQAAGTKRALGCSPAALPPPRQAGDLFFLLLLQQSPKKERLIKQKQKALPTGPSSQGGSSQFPGSWGARCSLRWTPPRSQVPSNVIKSQKSTSNSAGSSVGSLAPPRATPRLGGVYTCVSCQYFPCSFVLALRELGLRLGVKEAQLPLRASSRGVLPGAPRTHCPFYRFGTSCFDSPNRDRDYLETIVVPRSPRHRQRIPYGTNE